MISRIEYLKQRKEEYQRNKNKARQYYQLHKVEMSKKYKEKMSVVGYRLKFNEERRRKYTPRINRRKYPFLQYRRNSKQRGISFNLTKEAFNQFKDKPCHYCGTICFALDRVDNSIGYIITNVVSCCSVCNFMKRGDSKDKFIAQCKKIASYLD